MIKGIAMAQWVNRLRNKIFVNPPPLPLLCEISRVLYLVQPGLTAGRQAVRPSGRPADEIQVNFEIFKVGCRSKYLTCRFVNLGTASLQPHQCTPAGFSGKAYCNVEF